MRLFVDSEGFLVALEGGKALAFIPGRGWGGNSEALRSSVLRDMRAEEIPPEEVPGWLESFGAPMPDFNKEP